MYQKICSARGISAQRFMHLVGGFEPPTEDETLASTLI